MTLDKHRHDLGDDRLAVAIAQGFGFTLEDTAAFSGVSVSTVRRWIAPPQDSAFRAVVERVSAAVSLHKAKNISEAISTVVGSAEQRIARFFDRSFRLSEKLLKKAEDAGDKVSAADLLTIHREFTKWAAQFAAAEAPKRIEKRSDHTETHQISEETMTRLESFMTKHGGMFRQERDDDQLPS